MAMSKVTFTINEQVLEVKAGTSVLEAALQNDIYIPHLCYHPELESRGACRLCVVEIDGRLVTACRTPVESGMVVRTNTPEVDQAIRPVIELLIANHHLTCRGCPSSGKCQLQKLMAELRIDRRRVRRLRAPDEKLPIDTSPPCFDYDPNKCVLCGICIQTCEKIHGTSSLYFLNRGTDTRVAFYGDEARCASCLECIRRCPVGVLLPKSSSSTG